MARAGLVPVDGLDERAVAGAADRQVDARPRRQRLAAALRLGSGATGAGVSSRYTISILRPDGSVTWRAAGLVSFWRFMIDVDRAFEHCIGSIGRTS